LGVQGVHRRKRGSPQQAKYIRGGKRKHSVIRRGGRNIKYANESRVRRLLKKVIMPRGRGFWQDAGVKGTKEGNARGSVVLLGRFRFALGDKE